MPKKKERSRKIIVTELRMMRTLLIWCLIKVMWRLMRDQEADSSWLASSRICKPWSLRYRQSEEFSWLACRHVVLQLQTSLEHLGTPCDVDRALNQVLRLSAARIRDPGIELVYPRGISLDCLLVRQEAHLDDLVEQAEGIVGKPLDGALGQISANLVQGLEVGSMHRDDLKAVATDQELVGQTPDADGPLGMGGILLLSLAYAVAQAKRDHAREIMGQPQRVGSGEDEERQDRGRTQE